MLAAVLLTVTTWVAFDSGRHRFWLIGSLDALILAITAAAWVAADALTQRIARLREQVAELRARGAAPVPNDIAVGALRRSSEFLEFAQAAGGFGVFDLDLVTGQIIGTPLYFELLAIPNSEALFTRDEWLATVHPEDFEGLVHTLNAAIELGGAFQSEYRSLKVDSSPRWLAVRGRVVEDAGGLGGRAIGTLTDITERKQLE